MKISKRIYKVSGVEYETNSNIYAITYDGGIVLIDAGYQEEQWERMQEAMQIFGLSLEEVSHVFITHSHFDHAGNVWRCNKQGCKVLSSKIDADKIEHGNSEMERLFGTKWICGRVDKIIQDGDVFEFPGNVKIHVFKTPGHSAGSMSYFIETEEIKALATSDMFFVTPYPPEDRIGVELGYMGSEDFNLDDFIGSLDIMRKIEADVLLPGHYYTYCGKKVKEICDMAYKKAIVLQNGLHVEAAISQEENLVSKKELTEIMKGTLEKFHIDISDVDVELLVSEFIQDTKNKYQGVKADIIKEEVVAEIIDDISKKV